MNYGVPFDMLDYQEKAKKKYFLFVGMNHRIKNLEFIIKAFKQFKKNPLFHDYKLYLIGNLKQFEDKQENVISFPPDTGSQQRIKSSTSFRSSRDSSPFSLIFDKQYYTLLQRVQRERGGGGLISKL